MVSSVKIISLFSCFIFLLNFSSSIVFAATPTVTTLSQSSASVGLYQKFETTFQISKQYTSDSLLPYVYYDPSDTSASYPGRTAPYGTEGISIDAVFTSPSGKTLVQPAFYYQDYSRSGNWDLAVMTPGTQWSWKVRFAPEELGTYTYSIKITDKEGTTTYASPNLTFQSTSSSSKGFIRPSTRDPKFWDYSNGQSFIPVSGARQWWLCCGHRSFDYDKTFESFKANNMNFTRIWTQNDGFGLTVEGHFDQYKYPDDFNPEGNPSIIAALPKGNQMNQRGGSELDSIIQAAESNGVAIQICSKGNPYWIWETYPSRDSQGNIVQWKRNYRYRIARWGYSPAVFAWEIWNEEGHIPPGSSTDVFYRAINTYIKQTDAHRHMITSSQGSQSWSPGWWSNGTFDLANYHDYMMPGRYPDGTYNDEVKFVYMIAQCLRSATGRSGSNCGFNIGDGSSWDGSKMPIIWGELDTGTSTWDQANPVPRADHNIIWAGLFSPIGMIPLDWYIEAKNYLPQQYAWKKIAGSYFADIDYAGSRFSYLSTNDVQSSTETISSSDGNLRALGLRSENKSKIYLWVQNKNYSWKGSDNPSGVSGTVTVNNVTNGTYKVEYWDTSSGAVTQGSNISVSNGSFSVPVNNINKSIAIKIISTNQPSTPVPTSPSRLSGDANADGVVNGLDFSIWKSEYVSHSGLNSDFNNSGSVDGSDFAIWKTAYLKG